MRRLLAFPAVVLASVLALAGCAAGAARPGTHPKPGKLATGTGVTRTDITYGALIDYSGPFADYGIAVLHGQQIWINDTNAAGGPAALPHGAGAPECRASVNPGADDTTPCSRDRTPARPAVCWVC